MTVRPSAVRAWCTASILALAATAACATPAPEVASAWAPPTDAEIPADSMGAAIRRGQALMVDTRDSLPGYVLSNLNCTSCHLDAGRMVGAAPLYGAFPRFPKYLGRAGAVIPLEDRINYCMTRSLAGYRLPTDSREMQDMVAYLAFLARDLPVGGTADGLGIPAIAAADTPDSARGHQVYTTICATCHGANGEGGGIPRAPALWGPKSYSIGASMSRVERAASFVRRNMPQTAPGTLTDQQAWDVAAYVNAQPRPDMPGKALDWPFGGWPDGVQYSTAGHDVTNGPVLLPRPDPERSLVPPPAPADAARLTLNRVRPPRRCSRAGRPPGSPRPCP